MENNIEALKRIIQYEEEKMEEYRTNPIYQGLQNPEPWWDWQDVGVHWSIIQKLLLQGYLKTLGGKHKMYLLKDREKVKQEISKFEEMVKEPKTPEITTLPSDLFDIIEGYEDLKKFFLLSLKSDEPVHILLVGVPGTAKTLFMQEIERIGGYYITMGTASKVGIRDILYDETPKYLIIDEMDKLNNRKDIAALLAWMENGRIIITIHNQKVSKEGKGWVFGACNTTKGLPPELLDRFQIFYLKPYSPEQFKAVVTNYLVKRMGKSQKLATYIAEKVLLYTRSVREAIRIARLANSEQDVDDLIKIIEKYSLKGGEKR